VKHPNDSELAVYLLGIEEKTDTARHLASCAECARRVEAFRETLALVAGHETPVRDREETSDLFAAAWGGSRAVAPLSVAPVWRRVLQPTAVFVCGILFGFVLFSDSGSGMTGQSEDIQHSSSLVPGEARDGRTADENLDKTMTPLPDIQVAKVAPSQTPALGHSSEDNFWEMAGLRNVKLTPTVRSEDNREVKGAVLEGETLTGALVVLTF
jgi:hypothetical protein